MDCLAVPSKKSHEKPSDDSEEVLTKMWFFFCLVWSVGATLDEIGREKFDSYIREMDGIFPVVDTVYDYFVDVTLKSFVHWKANLSSDWTFPEKFVQFSISYFAIYNFIVCGNLFFQHTFLQNHCTNS